MRQALASLPQGLHDTYARIVQQIMDKPEYERSLGIRCLRWVLYAQRPLYVMELPYALATLEEGTNAKDFELDDLDFIFGACANLVVEEEWDYGRNVVRPIHYSVQEYFAGGDKTLSSPIVQLPFGNRMDSNARLAADCLAHIFQPMMFSGTLEPIYYPECWLPQDAFLHYAASYFDTHLLASDPEAARHNIDKFLSSNSELFTSVLDIRALGLERDWMDSFETHRNRIDEYYWGQGTFAIDTCKASSVVFATCLRRLPEIERKYRCQEALNVALLSACEFENAEEVLRCLTDGAEIECHDRHGRTPLHVALSNYGRDEIGLLLFEKGADIMARNPEGENMPPASSFYSNPKVVLRLLRAGLDVNHGNPLTRAVLKGQSESVRYFVEAGADVNAIEGPSGPALHVAS